MDPQGKVFEALLKVVETCGRIPREQFFAGNTSSTAKRDGSLVTEMDQEVERMLLAYVNESFPDDSVVGEEYGTREKGTDFVWYIDPIDGTDNFIRRIPFFCVSVARLGKTDGESFGIVHNPITGQMFSSAFGGGAIENGVVRTMSPQVSDRAFICTGRGRKVDKGMDFGMRKEIALKFGKAGSLSSCALETTYVGMGMLDGFFIFDLSPWDYAAGLLIARSTGAKMSELVGGAWHSLDAVSIGEICKKEHLYLFVSRPEIHAEVLDFVGDLSRFR